MACSRARKHLALNKFHEVLHLPLHLFHAFAHVQNDGDAGNVYTEIAGETKNEFEPLKILIGIETSVPLSSRRLEESFAFIQEKRLGMNAVHLGNSLDHVRALFASLHKECRSLISSLWPTTPHADLRDSASPILASVPSTVHRAIAEQLSSLQRSRLLELLL